MMRNIEVDRKKQNLEWMPFFLVGTGLVGVRENREEVAVPVELPRSRERSSSFDPNLEVNYLLSLPEEQRLPQLRKEVKTGLAELIFSEVGANYEMVKGRLVDRDTGLDLEELIAKGGIPAETRAVRKITEYLNGGAEMVVNISPEDHYLGYMDNMVDIWKMHSDGRVVVLRYKTVGNLETFKKFYKNIGGEIVEPTKTELLSDPVQINHLRLAEVMDLLVVEKCEAKFGVGDIDRIVGTMMEDFGRKFGDKLVRDPDVVIRFYLAAKLEVAKLGNAATQNEIDNMVSRIVLQMPIGRYLNANFRVTVEGGSHCGTTSPGGEFLSDQGYILTVKDGKISSYKGSTEGKNYCSRCGCWNSGLLCLFCDLKYEATC